MILFSHNHANLWLRVRPQWRRSVDLYLWICTCGSIPVETFGITRKQIQPKVLNRMVWEKGTTSNSLWLPGPDSWQDDCCQLCVWFFLDKWGKISITAIARTLCNRATPTLESLEDHCSVSKLYKVQLNFKRS